MYTLPGAPDPKHHIPCPPKPTNNQLEGWTGCTGATCNRKRRAGVRKNLKEARQRAGMTQQQVAKYLKVTLRTYQRMEAGTLLGSICSWDALEDLFGIHQRVLRSETDQAGQEGIH